MPRSMPLQPLLACLALAALAPAQRPPNIVLILADDLGYGELGCYGQERIATPRLDRLAREGMRFTQHYAGAPVCAPSRCVLLTGKSLPHAEIRGNREVQPEGQHPLRAGPPTLAERLRRAGYVTGAFGKWGLGAPGTTGAPENQGFDRFFGYNCQRQAHNFFPPWLWRNDVRVALDNDPFAAHQRLSAPPPDYERFVGRTRASDLIVAEALGFLSSERDRPFFLYLPFLEPHVALQPPQRLVDAYPRSWDDTPYLGTRGYLPHPRPRAAYAATISHLDEHVGAVLDQLERLGLADRTLVLFTSDNGPTHDVGGVDTEFFRSAGGLRGRKGSLYEGGIRVPLLARWPGRIAAGSVSNHVCGFQDHLPTLLDLAGLPRPLDAEGHSFRPTLLGQPGTRDAEFLSWEFFEYGGQQAIRKGRFKGIRRNLHREIQPLELYDLEVDPGETRNLAAEHPPVVAELDAILRAHRTPNPHFPMALLDP